MNEWWIINGWVMVSSSHVPRLCRLQASYAMHVIALHRTTSSSSHTLQQQLTWKSNEIHCDDGWCIFAKAAGMISFKRLLTRPDCWHLPGIHWRSVGQCLFCLLTTEVAMPLCICNFSTGAILFDMMLDIVWWCLVFQQTFWDEEYGQHWAYPHQGTEIQKWRGAKKTQRWRSSWWWIKAWAVFGQTLNKSLLAKHHGCHLTVSKREMPATMCFFLVVLSLNHLCITDCIQTITIILMQVVPIRRFLSYFNIFYLCVLMCQFVSCIYQVCHEVLPCLKLKATRASTGHGNIMKSSYSEFAKWWYRCSTSKNQQKRSQ